MNSEDLGTIYRSQPALRPRLGSQRRCYWGHYAESDWERVMSDPVPVEWNVPRSRLAFWEDLARIGGRNITYIWGKDQ